MDLGPSNKYAGTMTRNIHARNDSDTSMSIVNAIFLILFGGLGLYASFMLIQSELILLKDDGATLGCDVNPVVACSSSLIAPESSLFGTPNSVIGIAVFTVFITLGVLLASRTLLPRWVWWGWVMGTGAGLIYVGYFVYLSVSHFRTLCPYCMLTWVAFIGVASIVWTQAAAGGQLGDKVMSAGKTLRSLWWVIAVGIVALIAIVILIVLRDRVALLF